MGKLEELAKIRFANAFIDIVDNCKIKGEDITVIKGEKALKAGEFPRSEYFVECNGIDIDTAFAELIAANKVFTIAKEMGL